ncbi:MAG TPA: ABC transporter permease [Candidatus Merdisoma faecalis]|uniref:ABC transporter permease n=1 Tax=Lachnoclostridium sp. An138 TaxID=1965560 RepID=UPI000B38C9EB|nr:ABC transporter permease [Lachnoclostridium sp. An138]OUQ16318.1 ABC transporter permease [Lachnoclostridium sp. An138]HIR97451.1 ABC transporter permease [Candidatus Merdisoma faecalis]
MENTNKENVLKRFASAVGGNNLVLIGAIIVVFILFTAINPNYLTWTNFVNLLVAASLVGIVAVGHTYLIIAGQNDLSPGSLCAFCGVAVALFLQWGLPIPVAILLTLCCGVLCGLFNAWMVNCIKLEAFIATLVTQTMVRGFAQLICDGRPVAISNQSFIKIGTARFLSIPVSVWITIIAFIVFGFILARTRFGRSIYAIGGSAEAARLAGLNPRRIVTISFIIIGVLTALGGVVFAARMNAGQPSANVNLEFDAITAVILGGVSFAGGVGSMFGTVLGVLLIQAFGTGLIMVNVPSFWQSVAKGALLLAALTFDYIRKERREKELIAASKRNA